MGRAIDWIYDQTWAITEAALKTIVSIADRDRNDLGALLKGEAEIDTTALSAKIGQPLGESARSQIRGSTAVVPVLGPIFPRANLFTQVSGATSLEMLAMEINTALELDDVKTIVLDIDSPGGQVNGTSELVDMIFAARERKAIKAYIQGSGASGAYWIASAADEIFVSETAVLGSIGVMAVYHDTTQRDAAAGIKTHQFVSSVSPMKNPDPDSDEGRAEIQSIVDSMAGVMVQSIARNRGTAEETVESEFGGGGVYVGALAVGQGLADRIGSLEGILAEQEGRAAGKTKRTSPTRTGGDPMGKQDDGAVTFSVEAVRENSPETYKLIFAEGRAEGVTAGATTERERIQSIESLKAPGFEALIAESKFNPEATRQTVADAILGKQEEARAASGDKTEGDAKALADKAGKVQQDDTDPATAEQDKAAELMVSGANESATRK